MHDQPSIAAQLNRLNHPALPGIDLSLARMQQLLEALGHPERQLPPVVHIAGTNGKGSTLAFLAAMLNAAGYRVHRYTSPHLVRFNERILLSGTPISDDYLAQLLTEIEPLTQRIPATFFEATTALAFKAFAEHSADILLLETGLGGRLDATNMVAHPLATILSPIDDDHREFLGDSIAAIAGEKAGILKAGTPCFCAEQVPEAREVIKRAARRVDAPLRLHGRDWRYAAPPGKQRIDVWSGTAHWSLPLPALAGAHQHHNAALASVAAQGLTGFSIPLAAMEAGARNVHWPARLQRLTSGPLVAGWGDRGAVMLDGGHNPHAAEALAQWLRTLAQPATLILGMMARKDVRGFLAPLAPHIAQAVMVPIVGEACHPPEALASMAQSLGIAQVSVAPSPTDALSPLAQCGPGTLLVAGSLFLAGEVLKTHS